MRLIADSCGRREYIALVGSLVLIFLEGIIRVITLGLRRTFPLLHSIQSKMLTPFSTTDHSLLLQSIQESLQHIIFTTGKTIQGNPEINRLIYC